MTHSKKGMTLVEVLTSLAIMSLLMTAIVAVVIASKDSFVQDATTKGAMEQSRSALTYIENVARLAGYGIDPRHAFGFDQNLGVPATRRDPNPGFNDCQAPANAKDNYAPVDRDASGACTGAAGDAAFDDLAFRFRDLTYLRFGKFQSSGTQLTIEQTGAPSSRTFGGSDSNAVVFASGTPFIVSCSGAVEESIVVRASRNVLANDTTVDIQPYSDLQSGIAYPFGAATNNNVYRSQPTQVTKCTSHLYIMLLQEKRIRVDRRAGVNYLVMFDDWETTDITKATPLAANVESFQVEYVMNTWPSGTAFPTLPAGAAGALQAQLPFDANKNGILGDEGDDNGSQGNRVLLDRQSPDDAAVFATGLRALSPATKDAALHISRFTAHPANVRALRISLVIRSERQLPNRVNDANLRRGYFPVLTGNLPLTTFAYQTNPDLYFRAYVNSTIALPNMSARAVATPVIVNANSTTNLSVPVANWGG